MFVRVRTILVLGYRVLANTGRYWGGSGIGRYFFDCETRLPISAHAARRCLLSKPQSNSSRQQAAATMQHNCLDLLANNSGRKSDTRRARGKYTCRTFVTDRKDYRVSPLHRHAVSLSRPNFSNRPVYVWQLAQWATSPAASRAWRFLLSPVHCRKGYWRQKAHAIV